MVAFGQVELFFRILLLIIFTPLVLLHQWKARILRENGTYSIIPVKKNWSKGQYRKQLKNCFDFCLYWQRNLIESLFSALKRLFGNHLRGLTARTQRAEIYMRMIAYNLGLRIIETFY